MKKQNKLDRYFLLNWRKVWIIVVGWFVAVMLHNFVYAMGIYFGGENFWGVGGDEAVFFIIAIILIPIYVLVVLVYSLVWLIRKKFK